MLFSSPVYFVFFAAYFAIHMLLPARFRIYLIVVGSALFYGWWNPYYLPLPFGLLLTAYFGALWVEKAVNDRSRKGRTLAMVALLLLPLLFYKYVDFLYQDVLGLVFGWQGELVGYALPLGISFVTFTMIAYVVDVYRRDTAAERSVTLVAGYTMYFPQLIAGPILRPKELIPQLSHPLKASRAYVTLGFAIFSMGLLKKLVFADPIAGAVDQVYDGSAGLMGWDYLLAVYGFSVQIYCDFSGYTDMGIGSALMLGVTLPTNFRRPYIATSLAEFWRRWHITLSHWLRDYVYIPLGGSRKGRGWLVGNLIITMVIGGLWHGASWTFALWGLLHGLGVTVVHLARTGMLARLVKRVPSWLWMVLTFHFVTVAWVFFRAPDMATVARIFDGLLHAGYGGLTDWIGLHSFLVTLVVLFFLLHRLDGHSRVERALHKGHPAVVWPVVGLIWMLAITVSTGSSAKFIYFDF